MSDARAAAVGALSLAGLAALAEGRKRSRGQHDDESEGAT